MACCTRPNMENKVCISTKKRVDNDAGSVEFKCPSCNNYTIIRSSNARKAALKYTCPACGFRGPN